MIVKCAICGYETVVILPYDWRLYSGSKPDIWFCDEHRREWLV